MRAGPRIALRSGAKRLEQFRVGDDDVSSGPDGWTDRFFEVAFQPLAAAGELLDAARDRLAIFFSERRRELPAEAVPVEAEVAVRGVASEGEAARGEKLPDLDPRHAEHRPDDPVGAALTRSGEAREPASAVARQEVRLDPVLPLVRGRDPRSSDFARHLEKRVVANVPCARFRREAQPP